MTVSSIENGPTAATSALAVGATNQAPADIQVNSNLAEDTVIGGVMDIAEGRNTVAMFANPFYGGFEELLYIDERGVLLWAHAATAPADTDDSTNVGWELVELAEAASEVVTLVHPTGGVWAFCNDTTHKQRVRAFELVHLAEPTPGVSVGWQPRPLGDLPSGPTGDVSLFVQYLTGRPAVPALFFVESGPAPLPRMNFLVAAVPSNSAPASWTYLGSVTFPVDDLAGLGAVGFDDPTLDDVRWYSTDASGALWCSWYHRPNQSISRTQVDSGWDKVVGTWSMNFGAVPGAFGAGCIGVRLHPGSGRKPLLLAGYPYQTTGILGFQTLAYEMDQGLDDLAVWQDAETRLHVYGRDAAGGLCVIHQIGWYTDKDTQASLPRYDVHWTDTLPLEPRLTTHALLSGVATFAVDAYPDDMPSQHVMHSGVPAGESCAIYTQQVGTSYWAREKIRIVPSTFPSPYKVPRYLTTLTVVNGFGGPAGVTQVTLTSDAPVDLEVAGRFYRTDTHTPVTLTTDPAGRLTLRVVAHSLALPMLHVTAPGLKRSVSVQLAAPVHGFLGGTSTLPNHSSGFTSDAVTKATNPDGSKLFPGIAPADSDATWPPNADDLVTWCQSAFSASSGAPLPAGLTSRLAAGEQVVALAFQVHDPSRPGLQVFTSLDELHATRAGITDQGLFDAASTWFGDIMHGIQDGAVTIAEVGIDFAHRAWSLLVAFADGTKKWFNAVWDDVVSAAHAVESAFVAIGAMIKKALDWLKWALDIKDMWDTRTALNTAIRQLPLRVLPVINLMQEYVDGWFQTKENEVTESFESMKGALAGRTFGSMSSPGGLPAGATKSNEAVGVQAHAQSPHAAWFQDQLARPGGPQLAEIQVPAVGDALDQLMAEIAASPAWPDFMAAVTDFGLLFANLFNGDDPSTLATVEFVTAIDLAEHLIRGLLELGDTIVHALLDFLKAMLAALPTILDTEVDLGPLIGTLWTWIQQEAEVADPKPATVGDLGAMLGAFPITILSKAIFGRAPFPDGTFPDVDGLGSGVDWDFYTGLFQFTQGFAMAFDAFPDTVLNMNAVVSTAWPMSDRFWIGCALFHIVTYGALDYPPLWGSPPPPKHLGEYDMLPYISWVGTIIVNCADLACALRNKMALANWEDARGIGALHYGLLGFAREVISIVRWTAGDDKSPFNFWNTLINVTSFFSSFSGFARFAYKLNPTVLPTKMAFAVKGAADPLCDVFAGASTMIQVIGETFNPPKVTNDLVQLPAAEIGVPYGPIRVAHCTGAWSPMTWDTVDALDPHNAIPKFPDGLTVTADPNDDHICLVSGAPTPTAGSGNYRFRVRVTDDYGSSVSALSADINITTWF